MKYGYESGLRDYIQNSDEKAVLAGAIKDIIRNNNIYSVLDVGAGEGTLSEKIAPMVAHYMALEKRPENANSLRSKGLPVMEQSFPIDVSEKFDMALSVHSLPTEKVKLEAFVEGLVDAAADNGMVCVITYRTDKDPWYEFMQDVFGENWHGKNYDTYEMLLDILKRHGEVRIEKLDTTVKGNSPEDVLPALRFVYASNNAQLAEDFDTHKDRAIEWLKKYEDPKKGVRFPFFQYVVTLKKDISHE